PPPRLLQREPSGTATQRLRLAHTPTGPTRPSGCPRKSRAASPSPAAARRRRRRSEEHTSELQSLTNLVCRLLLQKKKPTHSPTYCLLPSPRQGGCSVQEKQARHFR